MRECSPPTCHMSYVTCHMSCFMCHVSHVTCHMSCVMCHFFPVKVVKLIGGGSVINGAYFVQFSKHRPSGPTLSISRNVRLSVCLSVCPSVCSLLRYRLSIFLPPLPEVGCPIFLEIRNPWVKVMERSGLTLEHFCLKVV